MERNVSMNKRVLALLLALAMLCCLFAGCGKTEAPAQAPAQAPAETPAEAPAEEAPAQEPAGEEAPAEQSEAVQSFDVPEAPVVSEENAISYPLESDEDLTMWATLMGLYAGYVDDWNDASMCAAADEATGVHLEVVTVNDNNATELFQLRIAAGDLEDLMNVSGMYSGGLAQAYEDEVIIEFEEEAMQKDMPDYWGYLSALDYGTLEAIKESDMYLCMTSIANATFVDRGLTCRGDWLEALGLDVPTTKDEFIDVLYAVYDAYHPVYTYKTDDGSMQYCKAAFGCDTLGYSATDLDTYLVDGKVVTPYITEEYYEYVKFIRQLYEDGLIYADFYNENGANNTVRFTNLVSDKIFMMEDRADGITDYKSFMNEESDPNMKMIPVGALVDENGNNTWGDEARLATGNGLSITSDSEHPELAMQYMNYFFTEPGILLANYGEEGVSWNYDDNGDIQWTDVILHNDRGLNINNAGTIYCFGSLVPTISYADKFFDSYEPEARQAIELYSDPSITAEHAIPNGAGLTTEEQDSITNSVSDICTYVEEHLLKYMTAAEDLTDETWDAFIDVLYSLGLQECLDLYQNAYDEYVAGERFITTSGGAGGPGGPGGPPPDGGPGGEGGEMPPM